MVDDHPHRDRLGSLTLIVWIAGSISALRTICRIENFASSALSAVGQWVEICALAHGVIGVGIKQGGVLTFYAIE